MYLSSSNYLKRLSYVVDLNAPVAIEAKIHEPSQTDIAARVSTASHNTLPNAPDGHNKHV